ncbi:hypothetical protein IEQ34_011506 [Dendrobium chrysotoxum]|uniref:Uncharacterized protein n=1 Tax=Dendrobium chrysotoxum TaxID=161865 RepID=A0AAV7GRG2_DENCH|nr:hypothetical protein IEQ34_011506 [Dendrobium chrysotoxum]
MDEKALVDFLSLPSRFLLSLSLFFFSNYVERYTCFPLLMWPRKSMMSSLNGSLESSALSESSRMNSISESVHIETNVLSTKLKSSKRSLFATMTMADTEDSLNYWSKIFSSAKSNIFELINKDKNGSICDNPKQNDRIVGEVMKINEILSNNQLYKSDSVLFESLRCLQLMQFSVETLRAIEI